MPRGSHWDVCNLPGTFDEQSISEHVRDHGCCFSVQHPETSGDPAAEAQQCHAERLAKAGSKAGHGKEEGRSQSRSRPTRRPGRRRGIFLSVQLRWMSQQLPLTSSSRKAEAEAMFWEVHWSGQHLTKDCRLDACKTLAGADQTQSNPGGRVCDPGRGCLRHHHHRGQACVCSSTKEGPYMCILLLMHQRGSIYIYRDMCVCVVRGPPRMVHRFSF